VLINITGGMDLAIDEVTQISSIIQEEAGDDAEIIFGAVHDPELEGKIRVTVIATGFDRPRSGARPQVIRPDFRRRGPRDGTTGRYPNGRHPQIRPPRSGGRGPAGGFRGVVPFNRPPERTVDRSQVGELDIPTFIRRQMD
jgi:cell division protein FtsZ